jgi:hypothetical protein
VDGVAEGSGGDVKSRTSISLGQSGRGGGDGKERSTGWRGGRTLFKHT